MNIFGGRPGIAAGVLAVIAILAASYFTFAVNIAILTVSALFAVACTVLCACKYITPYRLFVNSVVALVFIAAMLRGMDTFFVYAPEAEALCGENKYVHATVAERRTSADYFTVYTVRIHSIDGVEYDGKAVLNCEYNSELQEGYEFILRNATVNFALDLEKSEAFSFVAEEIFLSIDTVNQEDYEILSEGNFTFFARFRKLNSFLCAKMRSGIGGDEGRLAAAMLLGDKSALTSVMYRDFSRAGLSHYLAVSGLHVSIITGIVSFLLLHLRIKRWIRNLLITLFAVSYLFLLGFPVSAVRAVIMLVTVFFAYSMGDSSDSLNALGIAAVLILLVEPWAVFDTSFILSFCATLGIVCFMPVFNDLVNKIFKPKKKEEKEEKKRSAFWISLLKKAVNFIFGTLMSVSAALSLTLLPVTYLFGETSVLGYESNLAAAFAAMPLLAASLFYLFLGEVPYIGELLGYVIEKSARYMIDMASELSKTRGAVVSLLSNEVRYIVWGFSILIFLMLILKFKHKKPLLIAPTLYPAVIFAIILTASAVRPDTAELTFISTGRDENILVACGDESALIDISDGSLTRLRMISTEAHLSGYTEFDTLILTHYHTKHLASLLRFISEETVRKVILPYPETEADAWIMTQLVDTMNALGVPCEIAEPFTELAMPGGVTLTLSEIYRLGRSEHPTVWMSFSNGAERITYVGESSWESENAVFGEFVADSDILFFGGHGPVAKVPFELSCNEDVSFLVTDTDLLGFLPRTDGSVGIQKVKITFSKVEN